MKTKLRVWPRGMVEREPVNEKPPELIKAEREADREAKALKDKRFAWKGKSKPKSQITDFSYSSRGNMQKFAFKLDKIGCHIRINPHDSMFHGTGKTFQAKLKRADQFQKEFIKALSGMGYTGIVARHFEDRQSGWYTGQVVPHWHLLICESISAPEKQELNDFLVAQMKLPYPWYEKQARKQAVRFFEPEITAALGMDRTEWERRVIRYLTEPIEKNVLEKLDGEPIGRCWFKIGTPKMAKPIEPPELEPREHAVFTRLSKNAVAAKIKQLSIDLQKKIGRAFKRTKQMSTALKLHFLNPKSKLTAYLSADTVLRIHNFACTQTLGKKNPRLRPPGDSSALWDLLPSRAA